MGPLGLLGLNVPEEWAGADHLSATLLVEELGRGCGSTALTVAAHLDLPAGDLSALVNPQAVEMIREIGRERNR